MSNNPTVFEAVAAVMDEVKAVGKDGQNTFDKYNFRGIDGVMNAVGPALRAHKVIAVPMVDHAEYGTSTTGKGAVMTTVRIKMTVRWYGPAGDHFDTVVWGEAFDRGDKATAKAHSVAFRTAMLETLCLPTQEPDPDEHSYEQGSRPSTPQRTREQYVQDFSDKLLGLESAGEEQGVRNLLGFVTKQSDGELVVMAQKVLSRMTAVVDAEVVPDGSPA
jgi:hypothetical protein